MPLISLQKFSLAVLLAGLLAAPLQADYKFQPLGASNGLEAKVVSGLMVDREGFLWVASREGLYRYDGYRAIRFDSGPEASGAISDTDIRAVYESRDGAIWVATNTGGLNLLDPVTGEFTRYRHDSSDPASISYDSVYSVTEDNWGGLWVATQIGLNHLDRQSGQFKRYLHQDDNPATPASDYGYVLLNDAAGVVWQGTIGGGLTRWDGEDGAFSNVDLSAGPGMSPQNNDVFALMEDRQQRLWVGTRDGLLVIDAKRGPARRVDLVGLDNERPIITSMALGDNQRLFLGTMTHGIQQLDLSRDPAVLVPVNDDPQTRTLAEQPLLSLAFAGGQLFLGSWGAGAWLGRPVPLDFSLLNQDNTEGGLRLNNITAVLATEREGWPWLGSFGGGAQWLDFAARQIQPQPAEPEGSGLTGVLSLLGLEGGDILVGTNNDGMWRQSANGQRRWLAIHDPEIDTGLGQGFVTSMLAQPDGALWLGLGGDGVQRFDLEGRWQATHTHDGDQPDSLSGDYVTSLLDGQDGTLWVGTRSNGLNRCTITDWACRRYTDATPAPHNLGHYHVTALYADSRKRLWVATDGGGLHAIAFDELGQVQGFRRWTRQDGLLSDSIMAIQEDSDSSLWLSSRTGLTRFDPDRQRSVNYVAASGLPTTHFNADASASDAGHLYFGSVDGLLGFSKGAPFHQMASAPLRLTQIEGQENGMASRPRMRAEDELSIPYGEVLSLEFAVLDFAEVAHEYAYRLGAEEPWTQMGTRRYVTFSNLAPGRYRFEARGRDVYGQWTTSEPMALEIVPPYYMTLWFRLTLALALFGLILFWHSRRMASLARRNRELVRLQDEREAALAAARASEAELEETFVGLRRLTRRLEAAKEDERRAISHELHDELGQTLTAAKINLQLLQQQDGLAGNARLEDAIGIVKDMITQVRDLSLELRPPLLDEAGLAVALKSWLEQMTRRTDVDIRSDIDPEWPSLPRDSETALFRVVQESINNALKHSGARHIRVLLARSEGSLELAIEDDGSGFDPELVRSRIGRGDHLGMLGMNERIRTVGGVLDLQSEPGRGTLLRVVIPWSE